MITARTDTTTAVALSTDSVTTMLIITEIAPCSLPPDKGAALSGEASRRQTHILTLEFETPLLSLILRDVTCTETTEDDALIEPTITAEADRLIPRSLGTLPHNGPRDKPPKLLIPPKELLCPLGEAHDPDHAADLQAPTLSAAPAARAAAAIPTAARAMGLGLVLSSRQPHTRLRRPLWCSTQRSRAEASELKCKTYQYAPRTRV